MGILYACKGLIANILFSKLQNDYINTKIYNVEMTGDLCELSFMPGSMILKLLSWTMKKKVILGRKGVEHTSFYRTAMHTGDAYRMQRWSQ